MSGELRYTGLGAPMTVIATEAITRGYTLEAVSYSGGGLGVKKATLDTTIVIGIAEKTAASGEVFTMIPSGPVVTAVGTVTTLTEVTNNGGDDGKCKDAETGDEIIGLALEAATDAEFRLMLGVGGSLKA